MAKVAATHPLETVELRKALCETMLELAANDKRITYCEADLISAAGMAPFREKFPDQFVEVGIAEQSLSGVAAGLSVAGLIPFTHTFACFISRRACDQNYLSGAYAKANVKYIGTDPGINSELNGGSHMGREDVALFRPMPNVTIFEPCDTTQVRWVVREAAKIDGIVYIRLARKTSYQIYEPGSEFETGKGVEVRPGSDVTIISAGNIMLNESLIAADLLAKEGISARVIDMFCIKPLDVEIIKKAAKETGAIVSVENHTTIGGLGSAIADAICDNDLCVPLRKIGIKDVFGEVGKLDYLKKRFEMTAEDIAKAAKDAIANKRK